MNHLKNALYWQWSHIALWALLASALALASCASADTPSKKLASAEVLYASAVNTSTSLAASGKISDDAIVNKLEPAREAARASLDEGWTLIALDNPTAPDFAVAAMELVSKFNAIVLALQKEE